MFFTSQRYALISLILISICFNVQAKKLKYRSFIYTIEKGDTFSKIIKRFVKSDSIITAKTPMVKKIRKANPHIKQWRKLKPGEKMKLFISNDFIHKKKVKAFFKKKKSQEKGNFNTSMFYMFSIGSFNQQSTADNLDIKYNQNSPWSVGISNLYNFASKSFTISSSLYFSNLTPPKSTSGDVVETSGELGFTSYLQYNSGTMGYYGGFDYESFNTFNTGAYKQDSTIVIDKNNVLYATLGIQRIFKGLGQGLLTKLSFSPSIVTTTTVGEGGVEQELSYSGFKAIFYINLKIGKSWFLHSLYKFHSMTGADDLTTTRFGGGLGYIF